jgi:hypothetical protein
MDRYVQTCGQGVLASYSDLVFGYCGWPSAAIAGNGDILVSYSGNRLMHVCPFGKAILVRSRDEGKTWSSRMIAIDTPLDNRDSGVVTLPGGGVAVTTFTNTRKQQAFWAGGENSSRDPLKKLVMAYLPTISDELEEKYYGGLMAISGDDGFSFGEPFKTPVCTPHGPSLMRNGSLIYAGHLLQKRTEADGDVNQTHPNTDGIIQVYKLDKCSGYREAEFLGEIPGLEPKTGTMRYCEPHTVELPNGRLVVHIRVHGDIFTTEQSISDDGGRTFSPPKPTGATGAPPHLMLHSSGTLVSVYGRRKPPYGIHAMFSRDNAETWDTDWFIWNQGVDGDLGYPASVELPNGDIFTVYYAKIRGQQQTSILWTRWRIPA